MPRVVLDREGLKMEADLSLADIKELMGVRSPNGHQPYPPKDEQRVSPAAPEATPAQNSTNEERFKTFYQGISERGRSFFDMLKDHPGGIEANAFAEQLGFTKPTQIGGLVGGGLSKIADREGLLLSKLYRKEITNPDGVRTVTFYPGKLLLQVMNEKPA